MVSRKIPLSKEKLLAIPGASQLAPGWFPTKLGCIPCLLIFILTGPLSASPESLGQWLSSSHSPHDFRPWFLMTQVVVFCPPRMPWRASCEWEAWEIGRKRGHTEESWGTDSRICLCAVREVVNSASGQEGDLTARIAAQAWL